MLPQSYKFSHGICLNGLLQFCLIGSQKYQVPSFRYINQADYLYHLVRGRQLLMDMKYLIRKIK